ncbi:MAG TPA: DNA mismatch repair endonuclease MutL, partial [Steroidobacteraceae bacterium]|nr:DNA mismatch repair endonuclease MutL [Steroidobacteraceae bacterium]
NALDAGARRIGVEIEGGGLGLIRVSDDGRGLAPEELAIAFLRHATSKLRQPEDLAAVTTLGFRGEALPSIAAAAEVEFASRPEGSAAGGRLRLDGGAVVEETAYAGARGTVVTVEGLFERQPARRKFLRAPPAEAAQVATLIGHYAIAYPEVAFSLRSDGRRSLSTSGNGDLREAAARVLGAEAAAAMLALNPPAGDETISVSGLVSPPSLTRANRGAITFFVNRRWIQGRRLVFAVEAAYESLLPGGRHPIAIIDLRLPPAEVDVNVHPTKSEVRFLQERQVFAAVNRRVRQTLSEFAPIPHFEGIAPLRPPPMPPDTDQPMPLWHALSRIEGHDRAPLAPPPLPDRPTLPILRVVGQTGNLYIVAEGPDGMYLIDQHAAHERVLYEKVIAEREGRGVESQGLLTPAAVELSPAQDAALAVNGEALSEHGFALEPFGMRSQLLRAIPAVLAGKDPGRALSELLDELAEGADPAERRTRVAMTVACHAAVRAGKTMSADEMRELLRLLEACELPRTCPHGRPTMVHLSATALEREFRRR